MKITRKTEIAHLPSLLTVHELLDCVPLAKSSTYKLLRKHTIPSVRIGRRILIPKTAVVRLLTPKGPDAA